MPYLVRAAGYRSQTHQDVDGLDDIDEDLVLFVSDALGAPGDGVGDRGGHLALGHLQLGSFLSDVPAGDGEKLKNTLPLPTCYI